MVSGSRKAGMLVPRRGGTGAAFFAGAGEGSADRRRRRGCICLATDMASFRSRAFPSVVGDVWLVITTIPDRQDVLDIRRPLP